MRLRWKKMYVIKVVYTARNTTDLLLWILLACCKLSTICSKSFGFIKLQQVCENQTCRNLIFSDLLQVVEPSGINLVDKKSCVKTSSRKKVDPGLQVTVKSLKIIQLNWHENNSNLVALCLPFYRLKNKKTIRSRSGNKRLKNKKIDNSSWSKRLKNKEINASS